MNIFFEKFGTSEVAAAIGVPRPTLQSWLHRGYVIGHRGDGGLHLQGAGSPGVYRQFSYHAAMQVAVAKSLLGCGVPVKEAFFAAGMFAHTGEEAIEGLHPERVPGMPFNGDGRTFLAISGDKSDVFFNDYDRSILSDMFLRLGNVDGITVVDISAIFDRLVAALGHHPSAVMDIAYGGTMRASEF